MIEGRPPMGYADEREAQRLFSHFSSWFDSRCLLEFSEGSHRVRELEKSNVMVISGDRPRYHLDVAPTALDQAVISPLHLDTGRPISLTGFPECFASDPQCSPPQLEHLSARMQVTTYRSSIVQEVSETLIFEAKQHVDAYRLVRIRQTSLGGDSRQRLETAATWRPSEGGWLTAAESRFLGNLATTLFMEDPATYTYRSK